MCSRKGYASIIRIMKQRHQQRALRPRILLFGWLILCTSNTSCKQLDPRSREIVLPPPPPPVVSDDRIVLLGNALIERATRHGYLETAVTAGWKSGMPRIRNLGWSGDTVFGHARSYFGPPSEGFDRLKTHLEEIRPTLVVVAYGAVASFEGTSGLKNFSTGLEKLVDLIKSVDARVVLATPTPLEPLGPPLPAPKKHNEDIAQYAKFIRDFASQRQIEVIDLHKAAVSHTSAGDGPMTDDTLHFNAFGYWLLSQSLATGLDAPTSDWHITINVPDETMNPVGTTVQQTEFKNTAVRFTTQDTQLPTPPAPGKGPSRVRNSPTRILRAKGLSSGTYTLRVDGTFVVTASDEDWSRGVALANAPEFEQAEALREKIVEKSRLWFHRWRPQNETYLRGFRKHEQGEHAVEIGQFDPLIAKIEEEIATLRVPVPHRYELTREGK